MFVHSAVQFGYEQTSDDDDLSRRPTPSPALAKWRANYSRSEIIPFGTAHPLMNGTTSINFGMSFSSIRLRHVQRDELRGRQYADKSSCKYHKWSLISSFRCPCLIRIQVQGSVVRREFRHRTSWALVVSSASKSVIRLMLFITSDRKLAESV